MENVTDVQQLPPELLDNNEWNPNEMAPDEFARLVGEIEDVGFINAVQAVMLKDGRYRIIGGAHRVAAAKEVGLETIPVVVLKGPKWEDEDLQKLVTVRLNTLKGSINPAKMVALYQEMAKKYGEDALQNLFAYTDQSGWKKVVRQVKQGLAKAGLSKEKQKEFESKAKASKTFKDLGHILNEMFADYGDTVEHSFMVFTHGRKEHYYIAMNSTMHKAMKKIAKHCKAHAKDMNVVMGPAITALADVLAGKKAPPPETSPDDIGF